MRWHTKENPMDIQPYDVRKRWRFALWPTRIGGKLIVWLESYYTQQTLLKDGFGGYEWSFCGVRFLKGNGK